MKNELEFHDYIFVVLVYKNTVDIIDFIESVKKQTIDFKIIIVNSYYDDNSMQCFAKITYDNNCDFINIPNKGYSYGNNVGINYAKIHYKFQYLICSNPDIIIKEFKMMKSIDKNGIYCGNIVAKDNRKQNPMRSCESNLYNKLIYIGYKKNLKSLICLGVFINKLYNQLYSVKRFFFRKEYYKIFQPHGSFIIFSKNSLEILDKVFDDNMFLFCEEGVVAIKARIKGIPIYFIPSLLCFHKEDGSMNLWDGNINEESKKSTIYFFEKYYSFK